MREGAIAPSFDSLTMPACVRPRSSIQLECYHPEIDWIHIYRLKGSNCNGHYLICEQARTLRAWVEERGSSPGPLFLSKHNRPIHRTTLHLLMKK